MVGAAGSAARSEAAASAGVLVSAPAYAPATVPDARPRKRAEEHGEGADEGEGAGDHEHGRPATSQRGEEVRARDDADRVGEQHRPKVPSTSGISRSTPGAAAQADTQRREQDGCRAEVDTGDPHVPEGRAERQQHREEQQGSVGERSKRVVTTSSLHRFPDAATMTALSWAGALGLGRCARRGDPPQPGPHAVRSPHSVKGGEAAVRGALGRHRGEAAESTVPRTFTARTRKNHAWR